MYEFVADQVLGISGLINLSNIVFLVAFSVRDVLWLRPAADWLRRSKRLSTVCGNSGRRYGLGDLFQCCIDHIARHVAVIAPTVPAAIVCPITRRRWPFAAARSRPAGRATL